MNQRPAKRQNSAAEMAALSMPRPNNTMPTIYDSNVIAIIRGTIAAAMSHEASLTKNSETDVCSTLR